MILRPLDLYRQECDIYGFALTTIRTTPNTTTLLWSIFRLAVFARCFSFVGTKVVSFHMFVLVFNV